MGNLTLYLPLIFWHAGAFVLGAVVGSLLNVCIYRLPLEKSILWPGSRCGHCLRPIRWYDNLPLLSYWLLGGRCGSCGARFSPRYFVVELVTALGFLAICHVEIFRNLHGVPYFEAHRWEIQSGNLHWPTMGTVGVFFLHRATLFSLLVIAAVCDLDGRTIPLGATLFGTVVGVALATLFPWPWPNTPAQALGEVPGELTTWWLLDPNKLPKPGLIAWPVWGPLPDWLPAGSWRLGLATAAVGALVGSWTLRVTKFLCDRGLGKEALGLGDADLMMMAGAFLGWQPVIVAFFLGALVALFFAVPLLLLKGDNALPFGPGLAAGVVLTWLVWERVGPAVHMVFFNEMFLLFLAAVGGIFMFVSMFVIGRVQAARRGGEGA